MICIAKQSAPRQRTVHTARLATHPVAGEQYMIVLQTQTAELRFLIDTGRRSYTTAQHAMECLRRWRDTGIITREEMVYLSGVFLCDLLRLVNE